MQLPLRQGERGQRRGWDWGWGGKDWAALPPQACCPGSCSPVWQNLSNQSPCQARVAEPRAAGTWVGYRHQELGDWEDTERLLLGLPASQTDTAPGPGWVLTGEPLLHQGSGTSRAHQASRPPQAQEPALCFFSSSGHLTYQLSVPLGQETKELIWDT